MSQTGKAGPLRSTDSEGVLAVRSVCRVVNVSKVTSWRSFFGEWPEGRSFAGVHSVRTLWK